MNPDRDPMTTRAEEAHGPEYGPAALRERAQVHAADALTTREIQQVRNLTRLAGDAARAEAPLLGLRAPDKAQFSVQAVAQIAEKAAAAVAQGRPLLDVLPDLAAQAAPLMLPGASAGEIRQALTVASRLLAVSRNPSAQGALGVVNAIRGSGRRRPSSGEDFLVQTVARLAGGQALDLTRFLPGALTALTRDMRGAAHALEEGA